MKTIIALDCGTHTGWATYINGKIESGMQDFTKRRGESNGILFMRFNKWLRELKQLCGHIDIVSYEQAHHRGGAATEIGVGLSTRVEEFAVEIKAEHMSVHTGTLKKFITGSGKGDKSLIVAWFKEETGRLPVSDDESDALAILYYTCSQVDFSEPEENEEQPF
jgi:Holliday junction resolvasome RuvABC endonuclease subunit